MPAGRPARLVLEDGRVFRGRSFGAHADGGLDVTAEIVFNTTHTGYPEVFTDPSYRFEAVTFTIPILGIYGVPGEVDAQSQGPQAAAILCREVSYRSSNWRSTRTLPEYMAEVGLPGIEGIDTRSLVQHLRTEGAKIGILTNGDAPDAELVDRAKASPHMAGLDLAKEVTTAAPYEWTEAFSDETSPWSVALPKPQVVPGSRGEIVVVDFGVKRDILRHIAARGFSVLVVPASTSAAAILERDPQGVLLSNGPGDPSAVGYGIEMVRELIGAERVPVYGVCLGYQIINLALGAKTYKLKFGHRGGNHPVRELSSGRVLITSQNHGFAVDRSSLESTPLVPTHESLFDGCLEGVAHHELPVKALQFHPEAGPGPHDAAGFFEDFAAACGEVRGVAAAEQASGQTGT